MWQLKESNELTCEEVIESEERLTTEVEADTEMVTTPVARQEHADDNLEGEPSHCET